MERRSFLMTALVPLTGCLRTSAVPPPPRLFPAEQAPSWALGEAVTGPLCTDGVLLFVSGRSGQITAFDAPTGTVAWRLRGSEPLWLTARAGALITRAGDGRVRRLDPATGRTLWESRGVAGTGPVVVDGDRVLLSGQGLALLDLASGRAAWMTSAPPAVLTLPAVAGPLLLAGEEGGTLRARQIADGQPVWTLSTAHDLYAPALVDTRGHVFQGTTDGRFVSVDPEDGSLRWTWRLGADVRLPAATAGDGVLFCSHEAVLYRLDRGNGNMQWRAPLPSRPLSGPILVGNGVLVGCHDDIVVGFDARTGASLGALRTGGELAAPPVVIGDRLFAGLRGGTVTAFDLGRLPPSPSPSPDEILPTVAAPSPSPSP